jgi:hypothetical protein
MNSNGFYVDCAEIRTETWDMKEETIGSGLTVFTVFAGLTQQRECIPLGVDCRGNKKLRRSRVLIRIVTS